MTKRTALLTTLILSLVLLPGCPGTPTAGSAAVGDWLITYNNLVFGLELKANGEAVPIPLGQPLAGTFTWEVVGTGVVMYQEFANEKVVWAAELTSDTTMNGAFIVWAGNIGVTHTWDAVKQ